MQIKGKNSWAKHLDFMLVDLAALLIAFFLSYYIKFGSFQLRTNWPELIAIIILLNIVISLLVNPYSGIFRRRYYQEIRRSLVLVGLHALMSMVIFYVMKIGADYSRQIMIVTYILYFFLAVILKYIWKKLLTSGVIPLLNMRTQSLFVISDKENADKDIRNISSGDLMVYEIKGIHLVDDSSLQTVENVPVVSDNYLQYILDNNIDEVLIALTPSSIPTEVYEKLIANGVSVDLVVESAVGFETEEQYIANIGVYKTLSVGTFVFTPAQSFYLIIKRLFDIFCGLIGLVVLIPITVIIKLAYLLSGDKAPIFYRQKRIGLYGKPIRIFKFRSMVPNADEILKELLKQESFRKEWEENQKFENDPRITKVGHFIRKTSIDELPQLLNVLVGDMSLVGPRPLVKNELEMHGGLKLYQKVKPGITGWWGCNGRSNIDYRERLELEYYYVKNCSLYLDILCIIRTFFAVLKKDGAK